MDAKGRPVVGAVVEARGLRTLNGGARWGSLPGVDPLAVSDETGKFLITSQKPFDQMDVRVSARGLASRTFTQLSSGDSLHELTLTEGASVRGRVLYDGQPVTNVMVGMVSVNRDMDHFTGNFDIGTDSDAGFYSSTCHRTWTIMFMVTWIRSKPWGRISSRPFMPPGMGN